MYDGGFWALLAVYVFLYFFGNQIYLWAANKIEQSFQKARDKTKAIEVPFAHIETLSERKTSLKRELATMKKNAHHL